MGHGLVSVPRPPRLPSWAVRAFARWLRGIIRAHEAEARAYAAVGCREHAPAADVVRELLLELETGRAA